MERDELLRGLVSPNEEIIANTLNTLSGDEYNNAQSAKKYGPAVNKIRKEATMKTASPLAVRLLQQWKALLLAKSDLTADGGSSKDIRLDDNRLSKSAKVDVLDPIREKSVELLQSALGPKEHDLARAIESALCQEHRSTKSGVSYTGMIRSRYLNIKQNPILANNLLSKNISPIEFAKLTQSELATKELRLADLQSTKNSLLSTQAAVDNDAETDAFKCGRCGKRQCKYYQLQTRSADEPMTTFVTCVNCNNRWKFS